MPHYFFHLHHGESCFDEEGLELPNFDAACAEAIRSVRSILMEEVRHGRFWLDADICVTDAAGVCLLKLPFRDAVSVDT